MGEKQLGRSSTGACLIEAMQQPQCHYRISVKARVVRYGRLLVVKEGSDRWDLPGGGLEHGEDIGSGLRREVREELGVEVVSQTNQPQAILKCHDPLNEREVLALVYPVVLEHFRFRLQPPVAAAEFIDPAAAGPMEFEPYLRSAFAEICRLT